MGYAEKTWENSPSTNTALSAEGLNDLEKRTGTGARTAAQHQLTAPRSAVYPTFTRLFPTTPMYTGTNTAGNSIFWPWVVNVEALGLNPPAGKEYRLYESTDHDSQVGGNGGIYVRYSSSPLGPWANAAGTADARNLIYDPGGAGTIEVETPSILYVPEDPNGRPWYMYFQNIGGLGTGAGEQATYLVSSADGLTNWVAEEMYAPSVSGNTAEFTLPDTTAFFGDGHMGYFAPMRIGQQFAAYHLLGGSDNAGYGLSWSMDGKRWLVDSNIVRYQQHLLAGWGSDVRMTFSNGGLVLWHGQPWRVGTLTDAASGAQVGAKKLVMYPMAWDLKTILAPPTILLDPDMLGSAWETADIRTTYPFVDSDGTLYVYYQASQNLGVGRVDPSPTPTAISGMMTPTFSTTVGADDFNDTAGTLLPAHTADSGGPWLQHPGTAVAMAISTANRLRVDVASTTSVHLLTGAIPSSADYEVRAILRYLSASGSSYGVVGRFDSSALTGYAAIRNISATFWQILRFNAGSSTTLASSATSTLTGGTDYAMRLQFQGRVIRLFVDGVKVLSVSDTAPILTTGRGGVRINGSVSESAGAHLEDFTVVGV